MMLEAQAVAEKLGVALPDLVDQRIDGAAAVGAHKTSMLQDLETRPADGDRRAGRRCRSSWAASPATPTPTIDAIYMASSLLAHTLAAQGGRLQVQPAA